MRVRAVLTAVLALALTSGVAHGAPAGDSCTGTALPHDGLPGAVALLETGPGDFLGRWQDRLVRWHNGVQSTTSLPDGLSLQGLAGAAGTGRAVGAVGDPKAAIGVQDGQATKLTMPTGVVTSWAVGINRAGDIAIEGTDPSRTQPRYFAWPVGQSSPVEVLTHANQFLALHGIADDRRLLLDWAADDGHTRAATFLGGGATLLELPEGSTDSWSTAVAGSWIIGKVGDDQSVAWDPSGAVHLLPADFDATSVNRSGLVAGDDHGRASVWSPDGEVRQLPTGSQVFSVADDGVLVGADDGVPTTWTCQ